LEIFEYLPSPVIDKFTCNIYREETVTQRGRKCVCLCVHCCC